MRGCVCVRALSTTRTDRALLKVPQQVGIGKEEDMPHKTQAARDNYQRQQELAAAAATAATRTDTEGQSRLKHITSTPVPQGTYGTKVVWTKRKKARVRGKGRMERKKKEKKLANAIAANGCTTPPSERENRQAHSKSERFPADHDARSKPNSETDNKSRPDRSRPQQHRSASSGRPTTRRP